MSNIIDQTELKNIMVKLDYNKKKLAEAEIYNDEQKMELYKKNIIHYEKILNNINT